MDSLETVAEGRLGASGGGSVSPTYQHVATKNKILNLEDAQNLFKIFLASCTQHPDSNCLGYRPRSPDGTVGPFAWISYGEALRQAADIGAALVSADLRKGGRCAIFSQNCPQWMVTMQVRHLLYQ